MIINDTSSVEAIWDFKHSDNRIGSLYIFLQEVINLKVKKIILKNYTEKHINFLSILQCFNQDDFSVEIETRELSNNQKCWPPKNIDAKSTSRYGSMKWLAKIVNHSNIKTLIPKENSLSISNTSKKIIVVHLKNNPNNILSNADQSQWAMFFDKIYKKREGVLFYLIGDELIDEVILSKNNVIKFDGNLSEYFSYVCLADAFMGMSSAFCCAAILGSKPYRIWKSPEHHPEEMLSELDSSGQFPFHTQSQKFIQEHETTPKLIAEFEQMYLSI